MCQPYTGSTCDIYLRNQTVFVPPNLTIDLLEERLKAAYGVIRESKDMNHNCRGYALPSLCYSILPVCRTPEKTNHQYFANKASDLHKVKKAALAALTAIQENARRVTPRTTIEDVTTSTSPFVETGPIGDLDRQRRSFDVTVNAHTKLVKQKHYLQLSGNELEQYNDGGSGEKLFRQTQYPPTRDSENLRRICRTECELLENELCQKEYAIAKRHPTIGQKLALEDCHDLPADGDCSTLGISIEVDANQQCYWENGSGYRGTVDLTISGQKCLQWSRWMKDIANYPELAGKSYCR